MCSANFVDFLAEKILSFSSKMRDDPFQHYGTSFLMNGGNGNSHPWDPLRAVNVLNENVLDFEVGNPLHLNNVLSQILGILDSNENMKFHHNLGKSEHLFSYTKNGLFSSHLLNLISNLNSYHYRNTQSDKSLLPYSSILSGNILNTLFSESPEIKKTSEANSVKKTCGSPVSEFMKENPKATPDIKKTINSPVKEFTMSVSISQMPTNKTDLTDEKCDFPTNVKLNLKLADRKTKQMNKRSKKRRRRQKKSQLPVVGSSSTFSGNGGTQGTRQSPVSSHVSFTAESPGCKISFQHSIKVPSCVSSLVPRESSTNGDSEWESYDEIDHCNPNSSTSDSEVLSSSNSSPVKFNCTRSKCSVPKVKVTSSFMSFVVPVYTSSDDDSEWDACEPETFTETPDFEFTGLFLTNLCAPQTFTSASYEETVSSDEETEECLQLKKILLEVNKSWDNYTKGDEGKLKSSSKVTFAPDENLVEIYPVEIYERKGEWEMYATERLRFKRKIDELEKVLSPCLHPEHRAKIFKKIMASEL